PLQALDGGVAAVADELGDGADLAPRDGAQAAGHAADGAQRVDAVADDQLAGVPALLGQAVDLIAGQAADDHGEPWENVHGLARRAGEDGPRWRVGLTGATPDRKPLARSVPL